MFLFRCHLEKRRTEALHVSAAVGFLYAIEGVVLPGCFANPFEEKAASITWWLLPKQLRRP